MAILTKENDPFSQTLVSENQLHTRKKFRQFAPFKTSQEKCPFRFTLLSVKSEKNLLPEGVLFDIVNKVVIQPQDAEIRESGEDIRTDILDLIVRQIQNHGALRDLPDRNVIQSGVGTIH